MNSDQAAVLDALYAAAIFGTSLVTLLAAHSVLDHWGQSDHQARTKSKPGRTGHTACASHVAVLTAGKATALFVVMAATGLRPHLWAVALGLAVDAASHYWADRRHTLAGLAARLPVRDFYTLGQPREGHDDAPHIGTGAYALDQSFHVFFLFVAALIATL